MNTFWIIILCVAILWSAFGCIYYHDHTEHVKLRLQRFVLVLIGGPVIWGFKLIDKCFDGLDAISVSPLQKFERWLTKN